MGGPGTGLVTLDSPCHPHRAPLLLLPSGMWSLELRERWEKVGDQGGLCVESPHTPSPFLVWPFFPFFILLFCTLVFLVHYQSSWLLHFKLFIGLLLIFLPGFLQIGVFISCMTYFLSFMNIILSFCGNPFKVDLNQAWPGPICSPSIT